MRYHPLAFVLIGLSVLGCSTQPTPAPSGPPKAVDEAWRPSEGVADGDVSEGDQVLRRALEQHKRNLQVEGRGAIKRILPDDTSGSRHQRLILELASGQTILIAHNVDLAPRIPSPHNGDEVAFRGEYEWNPQGGVIHWTHRDPDGRHADGWLKHDGETYQ